MFRRCGLARLARFARRPSGRSPFDHVTVERATEIVDRAFRFPTSFLPRPRVRLLEEAAKLGQDLLRRSAAAIERLDPLDTLEDPARQFHASTVALPRSLAGNTFAST